MQKSRAVVIAASMLLFGLLSGCSGTADSLWPSFLGGKPAGGNEQIAVPPSPGELAGQPVIESAAAGAPPVLGNTNFSPMQATPGAPTGTMVGQRVMQLRGELQSLDLRISQHNSRLQELRAITASNAQRYHGTVAAVTARLQLGTTPGNPIVINQWNAAQADLDRLSSDISALNGLSNAVAEDAGMGEFMLETARATYGLAGAIDEDHRQLGILEDETNRSLVLIQRLLGELSQDISRQTAYVGNERARLTTLANAIKKGVMFGEPLASGTSLTPVGRPAAMSGGGVATAGRPLVVIRFDSANVEYEQPLYSALTRALESRPDARFDVVSVVPAGGNASSMRRSQTQSRRNAEAVMASIADMGLPASRLSISSTTSGDVSTNEVRVYMR
ncbi:MAG TPA: hypothetical protein VFW37_11070 [Alphaproteobacteria bacterium]|nr:hypothetical protein [Alphaproteobacteria bacterium]